MPPPDGGLLAGRPQSLVPVLADSPEQTEPLVVVHRHQTPVYQYGEQVRHLVGADTVAGDNDLGSFQRAPTGEHRQSAKRRTDWWFEELMAPVEGGADRQAVVDPVGELLYRQGSRQPGG
jgi:hypothetical protein